MPAAKKVRSTRHSGDDAPPADDALAEIEDEVAANEDEDEMNQADDLEPHVEVTLDMNAEAGEASAAAGSKRKLGDDGTPHVPLEAPPNTEVQASIATAAIAQAQAALAARGWAHAKAATAADTTAIAAVVDAEAVDASEGMPPPAAAAKNSASAPGVFQMSLPNAAATRKYKLPDGQHVMASPARPFLAMLPLSNQKDAKDGHVLMMPVQLQYSTMATLLNRPPLTKPYMTEAEANELSDHMEALVNAGRLRVTNTDEQGPIVSYIPGFTPPPIGTIAPPPPPRPDDKEVQEFQKAAKEALKRQIDEQTLQPQMATAMPYVEPPPEPPPPAQTVHVEAQAVGFSSGQSPSGGAGGGKKISAKERREYGAYPYARAYGIGTDGAQQPGAPVAAPPPMGMAMPAPPQQGGYNRPSTWQENLISWPIEAQQYTSGAMVRGVVRSWDPNAQSFTLAFENGSVEPAYLPQPSVHLIDPHNRRIDWWQYSDFCVQNGIPGLPMEVLQTCPRMTATPPPQMLPPQEVYAQPQTAEQLLALI